MSSHTQDGSSPSTAVGSPQPPHAVGPKQETYPPQENGAYRSNLEEYELEGSGRPPFILSVPEMKLLGIAGVSGHFAMNGRVTTF